MSVLAHPTTSTPPPLNLVNHHHTQSPNLPPSTFHFVGQLLPDFDGPFNLACDPPPVSPPNSNTSTTLEHVAHLTLSALPAPTTVPFHFWETSAGHAVILSPHRSELADWLSFNFKNLYSRLANKSNESIYRFYLSQNKGYLGSDGLKFAAQVMCTALTVYFDSINNTPAARTRGFHGNLAAHLVNALHLGHAFNVPNHSTLSLLDALQAVDTHTTGGLIHLPLRNLYHDFFNSVNV